MWWQFVFVCLYCGFCSLFSSFSLDLLFCSLRMTNSVHLHFLPSSNLFSSLLFLLISLSLRPLPLFSLLLSHQKGRSIYVWSIMYIFFPFFRLLTLLFFTLHFGPLCISRSPRSHNTRSAEGRFLSLSLFLTFPSPSFRLLFFLNTLIRVHQLAFSLYREERQ